MPRSLLLGQINLLEDSLLNNSNLAKEVTSECKFQKYDRSQHISRAYFSLILQQLWKSKLANHFDNEENSHAKMLSVPMSGMIFERVVVPKVFASQPNKLTSKLLLFQERQMRIQWIFAVSHWVNTSDIIYDTAIYSHLELVKSFPINVEEKIKSDKNIKLIRDKERS